MWWQVRALLEDRPGTMAAVATWCGRYDVNILGLQIFPDAHGGVVDEFVVCTPGGWNEAGVADLFRSAGVRDPLVAPTRPEVLEDQPTRYVRAATAVMRRPAALAGELARLLDAEPVLAVSVDAPAGDLLVLESGGGPAVRLRRDVPFTDTEVARAAALRRLAAVAGADEADAVRPPAGMAAVAEAAETPDLGTASGHGDVDEAARRLRSAAQGAAERGQPELRLLVRADDRTVLAAVHAAGLRARVAPASDVVEVVVPVETQFPRSCRETRASHGRPAMGSGRTP